jgi:hypothetical protein
MVPSPRHSRCEKPESQVSDAVAAPIILPWPLQNSLEIAARLLLQGGDHRSIDFLRPAVEAVAADVHLGTTTMKSVSLPVSELKP